MKAEPARQLRLLDLQALDTRLAQLAHARSRLPELAELEDLSRKAGLLDDQLVRSTTAQSDIQREVRKADADVQQVRDRADRDQKRLDSGLGSAKDLQALTHELSSLARRQSELEEVELEIMERAEAIDSDVAELQRGRAELAERIAGVESSRDAKLREIDTETAEVSAPRDSLVGAVGSDLVALYEKIRANSGMGAAALSRRRCGGCQLELNATDIARIRAAAADDVIRCEECSRILVRTDESGL